MIRPRLLLAALALVALPALALASCGGDDGDTLTIYSGRSESLVGPLLDRFAEESGVDIRVRYGDGTGLALGILEEGDNTPADVYYGQDVGAFAALRGEDRLETLPQSILDKVDPAFRSPDGDWVGVSGRARVIVYNTDDIDPATLPESILDYTDPKWKGHLGIVPRSDGFPEFVTALRVVKGDDFARDWLTKLKANNPTAYPNNLAAIQAVADGEIEIAFLNHYYLYRFLDERGESFKARNYYFDNGDIGGLFLVSGAAILDTSEHREAAEKFVDFLLSPESQKYFTEKTHEYPLLPGVEADAGLPPLSSMDPPDIDLSNLGDLEGSLTMMRETGILP
jgi:iron(III) transport system substrate-binding protein